ncbi:hypothetical protein CAPTEDRAFT_228522 [Capitella teleta]|uniref:S-methyl-5'-thioadenosine phosphorylase n=1 Tax=Capitella teleta TaxID=283909 RepID=R7TGV2_CAPTE|nr:hypothetical protein CAPTEDRAFT_228522 [Capitella teleta]|eukprot:ELT92934.1 hypothetical protein CAPTEDRAFT_228522 [Capitella teleta]
MACSVKVGIIGGTGLDNPDFIENRQEKYVDTPFGKPSDALILGRIKGIDCVILARHDRKHTLMPTNINYRANIWALKEEGCTHIIATTACGSLQEEYAPGDIVFLDQFIDQTTKRVQTFYDGQLGSPVGVCHVQLAQPFCRHLRGLLVESAKELGIKHHVSGTNVTVEGPRFSSKAESNVFRSWKGSIINMTTVPEVILAKEAGISYASIALVTDYDCWREEEGAEHVSVEMVMKTFRQNVDKAKNLILTTIPKVVEMDWNSILTGYKESMRLSVMLPTSK